MKSKKNIYNLVLLLIIAILIFYSGFSNKELFFGIKNIRFITFLYISILIFPFINKNYGKIFLFVFLLTKIVFIQVWLKVPLNLYIIIIISSILFFILSISTFFKNRVNKLLIIFFLFTIGIAGIIDIIYFSYFKDFPSIIQLSQIPQLPKIEKSILVLLNGRMVLFFIDIPILYFFYKPKNLFKRHISIILILLSLISIFLSFYFIYKKEKVIFVKRFQNKFFVQKIGILGYHLYDIYYNFKRNIFKVKVPEEIFLKAPVLFSESKKTVDEITVFKGVFKGKNIIIIQEESIAQWVIDKTIFKGEITPFLNDLKNRSIYFENFFDQTYQGRTSDSEYSTLNSRINFSSGCINYIYNTNKFYTLAHRANSSGYKTLFFHPFNANFWARKIMLPRYGFDELYFDEFFNKDEVLGWGLANDSFFKQVFEKLKKENQPFFAYIVTLTGHHPFNEISEELSISFPRDIPEIIKDYLKVCNYKDRSLRNFINKLEEENFLKNSVLFYFGDHDPGIFYEDIEKVLLKPCKIKEEFYLLDRIPFLIYTKNLKPMIISIPAGHIDIAPTIVHLFDFSKGRWDCLGENLFSEKGEKILAHPEGVVFGERLFYDYNNDVCYERFTGNVVQNENCQALKERYYLEKEISIWMEERNMIKYYPDFFKN